MMLTKSAKKILAIMLAVFMLIAAIPAMELTAKAESTVGTEILRYQSGNNGTWTNSLASGSYPEGSAPAASWSVPDEETRSEVRKVVFNSIHDSSTWTPDFTDKPVGWYRVSVFLSTQNNYQGGKLVGARITHKNGVTPVIGEITKTDMTQGWIDLGTYEFAGDNTGKIKIYAESVRLDLAAIKLTGAEAPSTPAKKVFTGYSADATGAANSLTKGTWTNDMKNGDYVNLVADYTWRHPDGIESNTLSKANMSKSTSKAIYNPGLTSQDAGWYRVEVFLTTTKDYSEETEATVTINHNDGVSTTTAAITKTDLSQSWIEVGEFYFKGDGTETVTVTNLKAAKRLNLMAIRLTQGENRPAPVITNIGHVITGYASYPTNNGTWKPSLEKSINNDAPGSSWTLPEGIDRASVRKEDISQDQTATWTPDIPDRKNGWYQVSVFVSTFGTYDRSSGGTLTVNAQIGGTEDFAVDTSKYGVAAWIDLGTYKFAGDDNETLDITNTGVAGKGGATLPVVAIRLTGVEAPENPPIQGVMKTITGYTNAGEVGEVNDGYNGIWNKNDAAARDGAAPSNSWTIPDGIERSELRKYNLNTVGAYGKWVPDLNNMSGWYNVSIYLSTLNPHNEGKSANVTIVHNETESEKAASITKTDGTQSWIEIGAYEFNADGTEYIQVTNTSTEANPRIVLMAIRLTPLEPSLKMGDDFVAINDFNEYVFNTSAKSVPVTAVNLAGYEVLFSADEISSEQPLTKTIPLGLDKINVQLTKDGTTDNYSMFSAKKTQIMYYDEGDVDAAADASTAPVDGVAGYNGSPVMELAGGNITFIPGISGKAKLSVYAVAKDGGNDFTVKVDNNVSVSKTPVTGWMEIGDYDFTDLSSVVLATAGTCYVNAIKIELPDEVLYTDASLVNGTNREETLKAGSNKVEAYAYNTAGSGKDVMLVMAIYSDEGKVLDEIKICNTALTAGVVHKLATDAVNVTSADGKTARAFLWMQGTLLPIGSGNILSE